MSEVRNKLSARSPQQPSSHTQSELRGIKFERCTDLYVENIECKDNDDNEGILSKVKKYAQSKGIRIVNGWVKRNRHRSDMVGCKIWLPESQVNRAMNCNSWPPEVICRQWVSRPRGHYESGEQHDNYYQRDTYDGSDSNYRQSSNTGSWGSRVDLSDNGQSYRS